MAAMLNPAQLPDAVLDSVQRPPYVQPAKDDVIAAHQTAQPRRLDELRSVTTLVERADEKLVRQRRASRNDPHHASGSLDLPLGQDRLGTRVHLGSLRSLLVSVAGDEPVRNGLLRVSPRLGLVRRRSRNAGGMLAFKTEAVLPVVSAQPTGSSRPKASAGSPPAPTARLYRPNPSRMT
jgi:hypothetical protein